MSFLIAIASLMTCVYTGTLSMESYTPSTIYVCEMTSTDYKPISIKTYITSLITLKILPATGTLPDMTLTIQELSYEADFVFSGIAYASANKIVVPVTSKTIDYYMLFSTNSTRDISLKFIPTQSPFTQSAFASPSYSFKYRTYAGKLNSFGNCQYNSNNSDISSGSSIVAAIVIPVIVVALIVFVIIYRCYYSKNRNVPGTNNTAAIGT